ncbi:LysR family transcriptional regulator [Streptomyces sp. NPDC001177]
MPGVDFRQLQYFITVATCGSYVEAARRLYMTQPALWRQVKSLEKELGVPLFERAGNRVFLTTEGAVLLKHAQEALQSVDRFTSMADNLSNNLTGVVRFGCFPVHIDYFLAPLIGRFLTENKRVKMEFSGLEEGRRADVARNLYEELREGRIDISMAPGPRVDFDGFKVYRVHIVALFPKGHPHYGSKEIPIRNLAGEPLLTTPRGYFTRMELERGATKAGFHLTVTVESPNLRALLALGKNRVGVPVVAEDNVPIGDDYRGSVVVSPDGPIFTDVWLHWRKQSLPTPASLLTELIRAEAQRFQ